MKTREQEQAPHFDLEQFQRSLKLLMPGPSDEGALEIMRMYLPIANGDMQPNPALVPALEAVAGGSLCVGIMPVRSKGGVPDAKDLRWCEQLVKAVALYLRLGSVPASPTSEGKWLSYRRKELRKGTLSPDRKTKLDAAIPGWSSVGDLDAKFDRNLELAKLAYERCGKVPAKTTAEGSWICTRRVELRKGTLSLDRKAKLDAAIPGWSSAVDYDAKFDRNLERATLAFERCGKVPAKSTAEGSWICNRRIEFRKGKLSPERKAKLDAAIPGWSSAVDYDAQFDRNLERAKLAYERCGKVPAKSTAEGDWLSKHRGAYRRGTLSPERKAKLDAAIPGWSTVDYDALFDRNLERAKMVFVRAGDIPSQKTREGSWLSARRQQYRRGTLSPERKAKLDEAFPLWLDPKAWRESLKQQPE